MPKEKKFLIRQPHIGNITNNNIMTKFIILENLLNVLRIAYFA